MDNLYFGACNTTPLQSIANLQVKSDIKYTSYQQSTNTVSLIDNNGIIYFLDYSSKKNTDKFMCRKQHGPIEDLIGKNVVLFAYLVQKQQALIITREGDILTVGQSDGNVDIKAQNDDGIAGASISPLQQYAYIATKNRTLIQLDMQFDLLKQIPIDDDTENPPEQGCQGDEVYFTWRADGKFMVINFPVKDQNGEGRKCLTRDLMLTVIKSPSKSDPDPKGLVQSVSQKPIKQMGAYVCWQPLGSIICSYDNFVRQDSKEVKRIIFWQKNGLRHLQFQIHNCVKSISNLNWIQCRPHQHHQLLLIDAITFQNQRVLLFYYRANYHWYLKNILDLHSKDVYSIIQQNMKTNIAIFRNNTGNQKIDLIELKLSISEQSWLSQNAEQQKNIESIFTVVDGNKLHITDFNLSVIPPPMSQFCYKFQENSYNDIIRASKKIKNENGTYLAVLLGNCVKILGYVDRKLKQQQNLQIIFNEGTSWRDITITQFELEQLSPLVVRINGKNYKSIDKRIILGVDQMQSISEKTGKVHKLKISETEQQFSATLVDHNLTLLYNGFDILISSQCTSYIFYHEFLLYTARSSGMYEKLFIFNLELDQWLYQGSSDITENLENIQKQKKLNFRSIERGGIIMACSKGRVILQLPRGNLQTFSPKIISICRVKKQIIAKQYGKAFQLIRTHKLDFNLIFDINAEGFFKFCEQIMKQIQKVDFINLLVSQLKNTISDQLQYCFNPEQLQQISNNFQLNLQGKKIEKVCQEISEKLRELNKDKYILSIFTSDIRSGQLERVLFEIKEMRQAEGDQNQNPINIAPHITSKTANQKKKRTAQQILEYVCWLVDAVVIYEQSLLTYDLELASITARCTQKDPKQYIPYLEALKKIQDPIQLRKTICLNLKKYDKAIEQLSKGSEENKKQALELIEKHQLFRTGLLAFKNIKDQSNIKKVKELMITYLISKNQINEAYNLCCSIGAYQKALELAIQDMDAKKIQQVYSEVDKPLQIEVIIDKIKQGAKNRSDLAALYIMIGNYEEAVRNYLKAGDYKLAYQYARKTSKQFFENEVIKGFQLSCSLIKNRLIKDKSTLIQKYNRLQVVQKQKMKSGTVAMGKPRQNDDMYSEISQSGRSGTQYTVSTTTGMKKKKDKKRSILSRNVKEGSPIEQEYLIAFINDIKSKAQDNIKQSKILIQQLIYLTMLDQALSLKNQINSYTEIINNKSVKYVSQLRFQQQHIQAKQLYQKEQKKIPAIQSFDYLLK